MSNNNIKAKVTPQKSNVEAKVNPQKRLLVKEFNINASSTRLEDLFDVKSAEKNDGSVLLYNANTDLWEITNLMNNQNTKINGGHY